MLSLNGVSKTFNPGTVNEKKALDNLSLRLTEGEFVTVVGGNGSGKTTLQNAVAGLFFVDQGSIVLGGRDITALPEHERALYLGRVFQDPLSGTAADLSIEDNLALALRRGQRRGLAWGISRRERSLFREELAQLELGLEDRLLAKVGLLSGGQRQALTLLMATLKQPRLLLLDEHTAALDPKTATRVLSLSKRLVEKHRLTTLMITHNMRDALCFGSRLIMMAEGKIIFEAAGEEKSRLTVAGLIEKFSIGSGLEDQRLQARYEDFG